jgi:hypothetical protein
MLRKVITIHAKNTLAVKDGRMSVAECLWGTLLWALFLAGILGVVLVHHLPAHLASGAEALQVALVLPPRLPLWLPWGCVLVAFLLWQRRQAAPALSDGAEPRWPSALATVGTLAVIVGLGALLRLLPLLDTLPRAAASSLDYDEAVYAGAASLLRQGYWPYRDFFFAHPPLGIALLNAGLWLRGAERLDLASFVALRQVSALFDALAIVGCYLTVRRLGGIAAGLLAALAYAMGGMLMTVGRQVMLEPLQSALLMFAAAAYVRCLDSQRPWAWATAAGILAAAACTVKLTGGVLVVAMVVHLLLWRRWYELGFLAVSGTLAAGLLLGPFLAHAPGELLNQVLIAQLGRGQEGPTPFRRAQMLLSRPDQALIAVGSALGLLRLGLAAAHRRLHPGWGMLLLWGTGLWAAVAGWASFYQHYYASLALAPACLVGAILLPTREATPARTRGILTAGLGLVVALVLAHETATYGQIERKDDLIADALALESVVPSGRDVLIFEPTMAVLSGHNPARLDNGQFFLDTYLWWAYADRRQGGAREQVLPMFANAQFVVLNGDGELRRIDQGLRRELASRLRREFWYRPLAHTQLHYRVVYGSARAVFDGQTELLSAEAPHWQADPLGVQVLTYWRAGAKPAPDQALFVHMIDAKGQRVTQIDLPLQGDRAWQPGDVMPIVVWLPLASPPPDGDYQLLLGLYSFKTGARATAQIGGATGDTVELENVFCRAGRCADEVVGATP